jgi:hypothetical protein
MIEKPKNRKKETPAARTTGVMECERRCGIFGSVEQMLIG